MAANRSVSGFTTDAGAFADRSRSRNSHLSRQVKTLTCLLSTLAMSGAACGKSDRNDSLRSASGAGGPSATIEGGQWLEIPAGMPALERRAAEQARDAFLSACVASRLNRSDFHDVSISAGQASGYLRDDLDWDRVVSITLTYREGLDLRRSGHRMTFELGAGKRPGIVTRKSQAIDLCGFEGRAQGVSSGKPCETDGGEDCILHVPGLMILDEGRAPSVVPSDRVAPSAWCFAHGFDPPPFWSCASTERACKKARSVQKRDESGDYRVRSQCALAPALHCFVVEDGKTVCAPDAEACTISRREWTSMNQATACEVATPALLAASGQ